MLRFFENLRVTGAQYHWLSLGRQDLGWEIIQVLLSEDLDLIMQQNLDFLSLFIFFNV